MAITWPPATSSCAAKLVTTVRRGSSRACRVLQACELAEVAGAEEQVGAAERQRHGTLCDVLVRTASSMTPARTACQRQFLLHGRAHTRLADRICCAGTSCYCYLADEEQGFISRAWAGPMCTPQLQQVEQRSAEPDSQDHARGPPRAQYEQQRRQQRCDAV